MSSFVCRTCGVNGETNFYKSSKYFCKVCWNKRTAQAGRDKLDVLIKERGGRCECCGYDRYFGALEWHHRDPTAKEFSIGNRRGKNIDELRAETDKCQLLCANCHREAHRIEITEI